MYDSPAVYWDWAIGAYLFLGGLSGGAYVTAAGADALTRRRADRPAATAYRLIARIGIGVSVLAIAAVGAVLMLFHLGQPLNALELWRITNTDSWMALGVWVIVLYSGVVLFQLGCILCNDGLRGRSLGVFDRFEPSLDSRLAGHAVGVPLALVLITYTAVLLGAVQPVVPLWHPTLLPALFVVSGLSLGISGTMLATVVAHGTTGVTGFSLADDVLIGLELATLAALLWYLATAGGAARRSYEILTDTFVLEFWVMVVGVGLLVPLALSAGRVVLHRSDHTLAPRWDRALYSTKFGFVLVGGLFLRLCLVYAAVNVPLLA